jgi:hypothetical protein
MFYVFDETHACHVLLAEDPERDGYAGEYEGNAEFIALAPGSADGGTAGTPATTYGLQKGHKIRIRAFTSAEACRGEKYEPIEHRWVGKSWKEYCATVPSTDGQPAAN